MAPAVNIINMSHLPSSLMVALTQHCKKLMNMAQKYEEFFNRKWCHFGNKHLLNKTDPNEVAVLGSLYF